jgi:hypothetical protein
MTWAYFESVLRSNLLTKISGCVGTLIRSSRMLEVLRSSARYRWRSSSVASLCLSVRTLLKIVLWGSVVPASALRTSLVPYRLKKEDYFICKLSATPTTAKCRKIKRLLQLNVVNVSVRVLYFCSQFNCFRVEFQVPFDPNGNLQLTLGLKRNFQLPLGLKRNFQLPLGLKRNLQIPLGLKRNLQLPLGLQMNLQLHVCLKRNLQVPLGVKRNL